MVTDQADLSQPSTDIPVVVEEPTAPEAVPSPQYATVEDIRAIKDSVAQVLGQQRGLQSKIDKDMAAERRRLRQELGIDELHRVQAERDLKDTLASVPEDMRPYVEPLYRKIAQLEASARSVPVSGADPVMEQARDYVRELGHDPDMDGIDYSIITGGQATVKQLATFTKHLDVLARSNESPVADGAKSLATPRTASPTVAPGPATTPTLQTRQQLIDAQIANRITRETFLNRWQQVTGQHWPNGQ